MSLVTTFRAMMDRMGVTLPGGRIAGAPVDLLLGAGCLADEMTRELDGLRSRFLSEEAYREAQRDLILRGMCG